MASGKRKPKWDIFEAVILLDGYFKLLDKEQPKMQIVRRVSTELRDMAVNCGIEIDEIY
jgi:hypothetical protein